MNIRNRLFVTLFLFITGAPVTLLHAAPVVEEAVQKVDWYDIDVIVFRHHDYKALSREKWARDPGSPMIRTARELLPALPENLTVAHSDQLKGPVAYIQLRDEQSRLQTKLKQLIKSSSYEPLIHLSWRQPGLGPDEAEAVHVHAGVNGLVVKETAPPTTGTLSVPEITGTDPVEVPGNAMVGPPAPFIDGTIRLIRKRFLHVEADFLYRAPFTEDKDNLLARRQWPQAFRLQESRRMRSREVHYLDHPMFGVLILATPYVQPVEELLINEDGTTQEQTNGKKRLGGLVPPTDGNPLRGTIRR